MSSFFIPKEKKIDKFVQEYLYIEAPMPVKKQEGLIEEKEERGVIVIDLF